MTSSTLSSQYPTHPCSLSQEVHNTLCSDITKQDIKNAIFSFKPHKAPGLDGFHPVFFQRYWNMVGPSVITYVRNIFLRKTIPINLNSTLLCLIPKSTRPETVHQFRPIGLCNTFYKTVTKLLVQILKSFLLDLIHPFQSSFIVGRKASDNVILT